MASSVLGSSAATETGTPAACNARAPPPPPPTSAPRPPRGGAAGGRTARCAGSGSAAPSPRGHARRPPRARERLCSATPRRTRNGSGRSMRAAAPVRASAPRAPPAPPPTGGSLPRRPRPARRERSARRRGAAGGKAPPPPRRAPERGPRDRRRPAARPPAARPRTARPRRRHPAGSEKRPLTAGARTASKRLLGALADRATEGDLPVIDADVEPALRVAADPGLVGDRRPVAAVVR